MQLCSKCKKRPAVVFITKVEAGVTTNEGLCLKCAKELGIKPIDKMMEQMGISEEDLDNVSAELENMLPMMGNGENEDGDDEIDIPSEAGDEEEGQAPAVDFRKLFGGMFAKPPMMSNNANQEADAESSGNTDSAKNARREAYENNKKRNSKRKFLDMYCSDLTKKARDGKLDRIIGRERELERTMQILCRRQKNNPCLIGEPGVGKTALAEALAQRIVNGDVPYKLSDKEVHLVDMTALVAGTQFRGQFEARIKSLIESVKELGNIILVIDEIHMLVGAGNAEGSMNAANILKPALSKGEIQVIGATTLTEYRKYIEKDSALERRFQPIVIEEPSIAESCEILMGIKQYYEKFHGIKIPDDTVKRAVTLSERYITDRFLPDKAIDLIDEASAYLALNSPCINRVGELKKSLDTIGEQRRQLEAEANAETNVNDAYEKLASLKVKELKETELYNAAKSECEKVVLTTADLAKVIEIWTGIPASSITEHEFARIEKLADRLKEHIVGQDEAVEAVVRAIKRSRAGISYKRKPVSFIFAGPTGVGKTELVKTLAADMFDTPESLIRLDMSEFMEKYSVSRIIGSPPGYVGYDDAGQLTEKIRRKPYTVVLFDEIEKAHPDVMNILLQILDDGRITDAHGTVVNFENTIIIMTTNAGSNTTTGLAGFGESMQQAVEDRTMKALSEFLRPEFINRVDEIITFNSLNEENFKSIAAIMTGELCKIMAEKDITVTFSDEALEYIAAKSFSRKFGARNMRRFIQTEVEDVIANRIIGGYGEKLSAISVTSDGEKLDFEYSTNN